MRAVVRRGETSGSSSESEDERADDGRENDATSAMRMDPSPVDASGARASTERRVQGTARASWTFGSGRDRARDDGASRDDARERDDGETPNTKLVASASAWLRDAPLARALASARARERELMILTQTSASVNATGGYARAAVVDTREATAATRRLTTRADAEPRADVEPSDG